MYVENALSGMMKRSGMDVNVYGASQTMPVFSVRVYRLQQLILQFNVPRHILLTVTACINLLMCNVFCWQMMTFVAGMEGLLGKEVEPGQEDVAPTAGLALDLVGVSLRPITFFTSQSGLMSAVWNAPAEPMSALQVHQHILVHVVFKVIQLNIII